MDKYIAKSFPIAQEALSPMLIKTLSTMESTFLFASRLF